MTRTLERELTVRFGTAGLAPPKLRVEPRRGRIGDRVAAIAVEEGADLVVVGSHTRSALGRLAEGSVSRDVLHCARVSVVCVPSPATPSEARIPELHDVLVATDFSSAGDAAVSFAYAITAPGGTVHLVHVVPEAPPYATGPHDIFVDASAHGDVRERLLRLVHKSSSARPVSTAIHILSANDTSLAICQAAARLDASTICLGSRGGGLSQALLGSVASTVMGNTRRPVLLVREPAA